MKALIYKGPRNLAVEDVENPTILEPTDAIIRITTSGICGSDLHMYEGHTPVQPGLILGHEPMGVVEEVGEGVRLIKKGDRVVMPFNIPCGFCYNCIRGYTNACLTTNPKRAGSAYGYASMGRHSGAQAELLRVLYADIACLKLPGRPGDELEDDFLLLSDVFPTGFHSVEMANVKAGDRVAIFGAGPVGLLAALSAVKKGAALVFVIDKSAARLSLAQELGAIPVNYATGDPVEQIMNMIKNDQKVQESLRPGEEKMPGVNCAVDAVGYQAFSRETGEYDPNQVLSDIARIINPSGSIGVIGVYLVQDPAGSTEDQKQGRINIPYGLLWSKGVTIGNGQTPVKKYQYYLRDMIMQGIVKPSKIINKRIRLEEAPQTYEEFDKRDAVTKAVIKFV